MARTFVAGSSQYGNISLPTTYPAPFTISCVFTPSSAAGTMGIVYAAGGTSYAGVLQHASLYKMSTAASLVTSAASVVNGTPAHLVVVVTSATSRALWVNGSNVASASTSEIITAATLVVGREATSFYVSGDVQEAAFWNRALSGSEIMSLYRRMSPKLLTNGLKAYAPMIGNHSPEPNLVGSTMSLTNAPAKAAHKNVYTV